MQPLSGEIDIDCSYVHPAPHKANKKTDRIDYRLKKNQNPDKRCVIVAREHYSADEKANNVLHCGAKRSHVFIAYTESQSVIQHFADKFITRHSLINTDESNSYDILLPHYDLRTVNHKEEYRSDFGVVESLFSRFKRMYYEQVHRISNKYLLNYANEIAYREDNSRQSNKAQFLDILGRSLKNTNYNNE